MTPGDKDPFGLDAPVKVNSAADPFGLDAPIKKKSGGQGSGSTLPPLGNGIPTAQDFETSNGQPYSMVTDEHLRHRLRENDAHYAATQIAIKMRETGGRTNPSQPNPLEPKEDQSIVDKISQAAYLPAFNEGFNDLVTKPLAGANDFLDRTIDKMYRGITGEETPSWLRKGTALDNIVKAYDDAYNAREKPTNMVSDIAEGTIQSVPLMLSMFTGEGEASLATKLPQTFGKAAKIMGTTGALNAYHDATKEGNNYDESAKEAVKGGVEGIKKGLEMDATMLVGGALGKGVTNKLAQYGALKGGKAGEAILHALAMGTAFAGTSAGNDLLEGKDINEREALKNFGMGLAFEAIPVGKALHDEISTRIEGKKINDNAANIAAVAASASNLNGESMMRTLMNTPTERLESINTNVELGHEDLYAQSIANGMKSYEETDPSEKRNLYINQLLLKTQGDVKNISSKLADPETKRQLVDEITNSDELTDDHKAELLDKINVLTPKADESTNNEPGAEDSVQANQDADVPEKVDEKTTSVVTPTKEDEPKEKIPETPKAQTDGEQTEPEKPVGQTEKTDKGLTPEEKTEAGKKYMADKKAIKDKAAELKNKDSATNAKLKEQKADIIDQMQEVHEALDGDADNVDSIKKAGYEVDEKGRVIFHVKDDGVFKVHKDWFVGTDGIDQVRKEFSTDVNKAEPTIKENKSQRVGKPGTGTDTDPELLKENIAEAKRLGNTKLQSVFERELARFEKENPDYKGGDQKEVKSPPKNEEKSGDQIESKSKGKIIDNDLLQPSKLKGSKYNLVLSELPDGKYGIVDTNTGTVISKRYDEPVDARLAYSKARESLTPKMIEDAIKHKTDSKSASVMALPFMNEFIEHDVKPAVQKVATNFKEALGSIVRTISPKTGVSRQAKDIITTNLNARNESAAEVDKAVGAIEKMFDKMPDAQRIDFIDRLKRGDKQATPELDQIADMYKQMDKDLYDEIAKYKESLPFKENHFRVLWKELPGSEKSKSWFGMAKRPLEGSKGFLKKATLADISEGIERGGVPLSTNPMTMFKAAYADAMKFITAHRMFDGLKDDDYVKFVKNGSEVPDGYVKIDDKIAQVYFPVKEGLVKTGEYYIEKNAGRLVNNHLSRDLIRESSIGRGLVNLKNLYTAAELGLSGYHASAIALEGVSSDIGRGFRKLINLGIKGDFKSAGEGIADILKAPFSPKTTFSLGRNTIKLATEKEFETSDFGKKFLRVNPTAKEYIHDLFMGGGLMKQNADLKANTYKALKEHAGKDNYIGAAIRTIPALNEMVMSPLFDHYIPAMKVGMFMKEFPLALKENEAALASGKITRPELARKTVDFIDDRLGEMNFDNLFWNRTFKTSMQLMLRSVTWKLGNLRAMGGAPIEQAMEFYNAAKEKRAPNLSPKLAWVVGLATMQTALSTVTQYLATGTYPQTVKDLVAPRMDKNDDKQRMILPTYIKDVMHLRYKGPVDYATSSLSGDVTKLFDVWNNSDFQKYQIYNPNDDVVDKAKDIGAYVLPKPISISGLQKSIKEGDNYPQMAMSFFGMNKAPKYLTNPPIENKIFDLYNLHEGVKSKGQKEVRDVKEEILSLYRQQKYDAAEKIASDAMEKGLITQKQFGYLNKRVGAQRESPAKYFFNELPIDDKVSLWKEMTEKEREEFDPKGKVAQKVQIEEQYEQKHKKNNSKPYSSFDK